MNLLMFMSVRKSVSWYKESVIIIILLISFKTVLFPSSRVRIYKASILVKILVQACLFHIKCRIKQAV